MTKTRVADVPLPPLEQQMLTRLEACRVARIGLSTFDKAVADKRISVHRNGTRILVTRRALDAYIATMPGERMHSTRGQHVPASPEGGC